MKLKANFESITKPFPFDFDMNLFDWSHKKDLSKELEENKQKIIQVKRGIMFEGLFMREMNSNQDCMKFHDRFISKSQRNNMANFIVDFLDTNRNLNEVIKVIYLKYIFAFQKLEEEDKVIRRRRSNGGNKHINMYKLGEGKEAECFYRARYGFYNNLLFVKNTMKKLNNKGLLNFFSYSFLLSSLQQTLTELAFIFGIFDNLNYAQRYTYCVSDYAMQYFNENKYFNYDRTLMDKTIDHIFQLAPVKESIMNKYGRRVSHDFYFFYGKKFSYEPNIEELEKIRNKIEDMVDEIHSYLGPKCLNYFSEKVLNKHKENKLLQLTDLIIILYYFSFINKTEINITSSLGFVKTEEDGIFKNWNNTLNKIIHEPDIKDCFSGSSNSELSLILSNYLLFEKIASNEKTISELNFINKGELFTKPLFSVLTKISSMKWSSYKLATSTLRFYIENITKIIKKYEYLFYTLNRQSRMVIEDNLNNFILEIEYENNLLTGQKLSIYEERRNGKETEFVNYAFSLFIILNSFNKDVMDSYLNIVRKAICQEHPEFYEIGTEDYIYKFLKRKFYDIFNILNENRNIKAYYPYGKIKD